jgi:hypothetical protein
MEYAFAKEGLLPVGWHRVTWTFDDRKMHVVTNDIASAALAVSALRQDIVMHDVEITSWSDQPRGGRST